MKIKHVFFLCVGLLGFSLINDMDFKPKENVNKDGYYQISQVDKPIPLSTAVEIAQEGQTLSPLMQALQDKDNQNLILKENQALDLPLKDKKVHADIKTVTLEGTKVRVVSNSDKSDVIALNQDGQVLFLKDSNRDRFVAQSAQMIKHIREVALLDDINDIKHEDKKTARVSNKI